MNNEPLTISYKPFIGLEVHIELKTKSKMFCGCSADYFGQKPNTHTCPVCLGLPGALPVPNKTAIEWCIKIGLALNCHIPLISKFDRKNYFYPDLPKGYQISQYDEPFAVNGHVILGKNTERAPESKTDSGHIRYSQYGQARLAGALASRRSGGPAKRAGMTAEKRIGIRRVHMEEDTGKLIHATVDGEKVSLIDFNRSGVPLVEIVTEPDFESAEEVKEYLQKLQQIVRFLGVSDANMEKGEMRLEPNISMKPVILGKNTERAPESQKDAGQVLRQRAQDYRAASSMKNKLPTYRVEVKNINSFRFVRDAINYELGRQRKILEKGEIPTQETRGWNEKRRQTFSQRTKEEASDYRYFPEPDIPPIRFTQNKISNIKNQIGELSEEKLKRFQKEYGLSEYYSEILTKEKEIADYFEASVEDGKKFNIKSKEIANFIINQKINTAEVLPAELIKRIISAKKIISISDDALEKIVNKVIKTNDKAVGDYKEGKTNVIMFLVGQVLKTAKQKLDTKTVKEKLEKFLKE